MLTLKGKYAKAIVLIDENDEETIKQINSFLNHPAFAHTYIAIMPDCHAGAGAVIGFTAKLNDYVIPNVVGVDIGCGMLATKLSAKEIDFAELDKFIRKHIPNGFSRHQRPLNRNWENDGIKLDIPQYDSFMLGKIEEVCENTGQEFADVHCQLQSLGGGNHFIEIDVDEDGNHWLVIHTGSRNFGLKVANFHQGRAKDLAKKMLIPDSNKGLEYLPMDFGGDYYLEDMRIVQDFAMINRDLIAGKIIKGFFKEEPKEVSVESVHNYIGYDNIIRKGAISAYEGEKMLIPLNMRDGILFCTGKGNAKWNYSAPHGAGRVLSRKKAKDTLNLKQFEKEMKGIWSSCISQDTLDESPMAYKDGSLIVELIGETADIDFVAKPVYNFKAS